MRQKLLDFLQVELEMVEGFCNWAFPSVRGSGPVSCLHLLVTCTPTYRTPETSEAGLSLENLSWRLNIRITVRSYYVKVRKNSQRRPEAD